MSDRLLLNFMPLRGGLATAGQRSTINEAQLWSATNLYPDLDGMLRGRPGLVQWGQTITTPNTTAAHSFHELFSNTNSWVVTTTGNADMTQTVALGLLTLSLGQTTTGSPTDSAIVFSRQYTDESSEGHYALKFNMRLINPYGADTDGGKLYIKVSGDSGVTVHQYMITADGVYLYEGGGGGTATLRFTPDYGLDLGGYHSYEIYYNDTTGVVSLFVDGVAATEFTPTATHIAFTDATCNTVEFRATLLATPTVAANEKAWTLNITDMQYADMKYADTPFSAKSIVDVGQYSRLLTGGATKSSLFVATDDRLYVDINRIGAWRPMMPLWAGHTFMMPFQNKMLFFDDNGQNNARLYSWDGIDPPVQITDAPPVRFGTSHRTRLWAAGDRNHPLRAYFTASRRAEVWFAPDYDSEETVDEVINAGYIEIDSYTGDQINGIYGEYFGSLIIETERGLWRVTGSSPLSFQVENISKKIGGGSPWGMVQIGNDLYGVGRTGVYSISTAQTSGDVQTALPSGAIADKWSSLPNVPGRVDWNQLYSSYFAALPSLNLAVLGMRGQGQTHMDLMYVFAPMSQQWYGPWTVNATCFAQIDLGTPAVEVLLHGHENGKVSVTGLNVTTDFGASFTRTFKSPMLNGRSVAQELISRVKRWRSLRMYVLPRFNREFTLSWRTDLNAFLTETHSQDPSNGPSLSDDFRLDVDYLRSPDEVAIIEVPLDDRGRYFHFEWSSDYDIAFQGYQVELLPGDEED